MKLGLGLGLVGIHTLATVGPTIADIHQAKKEGRNTAWAATTSAVRNNWANLLLLGAKRPIALGLGLAALQVSPAIASAAYGYYQTRNNWIRLTRTPFSQLFEHSDWTMQHQQRGMQSILGARSMLGSEAARMSARYGRS